MFHRGGSRGGHDNDEATRHADKNHYVLLLAGDDIDDHGPGDGDDATDESEMFCPR